MALRAWSKSTLAVVFAAMSVTVTVRRAIRVVHRHLRRKVSYLVRSIWPTGPSRGHRCSDQLRSVASARGTWTRSEPPVAVTAVMQRASPASRWCLAAKLPELGWGICLARSSCCRVIGWACSSQRDLLQPRARGWRVVGADSASTRRCNLAYSSARAHSKGAAYVHRSSCEVFTAARRRGQSPLRSKPRGRRDGSETIISPRPDSDRSEIVSNLRPLAYSR